MGLLSTIFGTDTAIKESSRTVNNIFDGIASGIDKAVYTDEEKADYNAANQKLRFETLKLVLANSSQGDSLTRRILAYFIVFFYFGCGFLSWTLSIFTLTENYAKGLYNLITTSPPGYVTAVLSIYFGYFGIKQSVGKWKS